MLAAIYARYSDSKQTEQSIEGQLAVCHQYAQEQGYNVVTEYIDRAQTGRNDDRYQFQKMMKDSGKGLFNVIIVYAQNRLGRNTRQMLNNIKYLRDNGVNILSATEMFDNTPAGKMYQTMMMAYDQFYSEELTQKVIRGMTLNAQKCVSNGGPPPLGYKVVDKKYVRDEKTAPIVEEIYQKYADGWSIKDICDNLNERKIKTSKGARFNKNSLHTLLKNRKYLGVYIYKDIEIPDGMPRIIQDELFEKVQERMQINTQMPARSKAKEEYLLTSKLYCGYCKTMMIGHSANKQKRNSQEKVTYRYYICKKSGSGKPCKKKRISKDYLEDVVVAECKSLLTPSNITRIAREIVKISVSMDDTSELKRLENLLNKAQKEKDNQMTSLRQCAVDCVREMIIEDLSKIASEIKELGRQLEIEKSRHYIMTEEQVVAKLTALADGDIRNSHYRKTLIKLFVNRIDLYDDRYTIIFNTGDDEVTITDRTLEKIERSSNGEKSFCLSNVVGHQDPQCVCIGDF